MLQAPLHFTKMHGLGNDFIIIHAKSDSLDLNTLPFALMANRHLGIGCDQILIIETSTEADFFCRIINADGSEAEQCGNGLRAAARFVHETSLHLSKHLTIATIAGIFPIEINDYHHIRVTLPVIGLESSLLNIPLPLLDTVIDGTSVSLGNPHFIIKVTNLDTTHIKQIGSNLSTHPSFPKGTNVGFMQVMNPGHIRLRTYERGSGQTYACGSNACAAVLAGIQDGCLHKSVIVEFEFGQLIIEWEGKDSPVHMTGPATWVFTGEWQPK